MSIVSLVTEKHIDTEFELLKQKFNFDCPKNCEGEKVLKLAYYKGVKVGLEVANMVVPAVREKPE